MDEDRFRGIASKLADMAKAGDVPVANLLLSYCVGTPREAPDPDRLNLDEWLLRAAAPTPLDVLRCAIRGVDPGLAAVMLARWVASRDKPEEWATPDQQEAALRAIAKEISAEEAGTEGGRQQGCPALRGPHGPVALAGPAPVG